MNDLTLKRYISKNLKLDDYKGKYRLMTQFPPCLNDALMGILLSDGGLERLSSSSNVRLSLNMSVENLPSIIHIYNLFEPYIDTVLNITILYDLLKLIISNTFKTVSMPKLVFFYNIFYLYSKKDNKVKKIMPLEIESNFNEISLAHLIMGDGNYLNDRNIIRIYTNSFTNTDVLLLSNVINKNLCIRNKVVHDRNNQYIIIIEKDNVNNTRDIILPLYTS